MSILRLWVIGSAFVAVLILLAGWFLGVQPRLAEASALCAEPRAKMRQRWPFLTT